MSCEILMVRNVADTDGYPCRRPSMAECADCGSRLCDLHWERCDLCQRPTAAYVWDSTLCTPSRVLQCQLRLSGAGLSSQDC